MKTELIHMSQSIVMAAIRSEKEEASISMDKGNIDNMIHTMKHENMQN